MTSTAHWRIPDLAHLHWRAWDNEFVVFNEATGHTHVVDAWGAVVLQSLEAGSASLDDLRRELIGQLGLSESIELQIQLAELLRRFHMLGLVEDLAS